ncbi:hypothetical protein [Cupriavidus sp. IK-TO18]|uniref:hypothetical protein n=1 Tax=Cupriavidus sp. IK-TO18 TaxID=2782182 RepID=UPI00189BE3F2|nr:hypothetical protein [Cupriavidus sp. IK-TO18]MBF6992324.1 hypothetical protein [Cupriavidus sp. IK-TO18]
MTDECEAEIRGAYARRLLELQRIGRASDGRPILPDPDTVRQLEFLASTRCGAAVAAAIKRAKRRLVFRRLASTTLDVTPTVALHCAQRLLGRGIDGRAALAAFATTGRTAAEKSPVTAYALAELEAQAREQLFELVTWIGEVKREIAEEWHNAPELAAIFADWETQRAVQRRRRQQRRRP